MDVVLDSAASTRMDSVDSSARKFPADPCPRLSELRLLSDDPATGDDFGNIQPVATALCNLIRSQPNGQAVMLEGSWGSGKSTVVSLVKQELEKDKHTTVFLYDSWSYQGDTLRRSFLELLIAHLNRLSWGDLKRQSEIRKELSSRVIHTDTRKSPRLTAWGRFIGLSLLFLPLGFAFVTSALRSKVDQPVRFLGVDPLWIGVVLLFIPALLALVAWLCRKGHEDDDPTAIFMQKVVEDESTTSTRSPEPTPVEFHDYFHEVIDSALTDTRRKLVVVIDNLDRLEEETARAAWATVSGFFDTAGLGQRHEPMNRVWMLVPFAPSALRKLWGDDGGDSAPSCGDTFRDKTFPVRLHVPPQMQADWRQYFVTKLQEAIPCVENLLLAERVYRIFSMYGRFDASPTPRDIKLFINRLVALHIARGHDIPLAYMALYSLHESRITRDGSQLRDDQFIAPTDAQIMDTPHWRRNLAALHFGVPPNESLSILYGRDIDKALADGDSKNLEQLLADEASKEVCSQRVRSLAEAWKKQNMFAEMTQAARALPPDDKSAFMRGARITVLDAVRAIHPAAQYWVNSTTAQGLLAVMRYPEAKDRSALAAELLAIMTASAYGNEVDPADSLGSSNPIIAEWGQGTATLIAGLIQMGLGDIVKREFRIDRDRGYYLAVLRGMHKLKPEPGQEVSDHMFPVDKTAASLPQYLADRCEKDQLTSEWQQAVRRAIHALPSLNWDGLVSKLYPKLQDQNLPLAVVQGCAQALIDIGLETKPKLGQVTADQVAGQLSTAGYITAQMQRAFDVKEDGLAATLATICIWKKVTAASAGAGGAGQSGYARFADFCREPQKQPGVMQPLVRRVASHLTLPRFLEHAAAMKMPNGLPVAVIKEFVADDARRSRLTAGMATAYYPVFSRAIDGDTFGRFQETSGLLASVLAEAQRRGLDGDTQALLNQLLLLDDLQSIRDFVQLAVVELRKLDRETWAKELSSEGGLLRLALQLRSINVDVSLDVNFQDPLLQLVKDVRLAKKSLPVRGPQPPSLDLLLSSTQRTVFWHSVLTALLEPEAIDQPLEKLIAGMGSDLIRGVPFETRGRDVFSRLLRGALTRKNATELAWVRDLLKGRPQLVVGEAVPHDAVDDFRKRVLNLASDTNADDKVKEMATEIAALLETPRNVPLF